MGGNPDPAIAHPQRHRLIVGGVDTHGDVHRFSRVLDRVVEKIVDRGAQFFRIAVHANRFLARILFHGFRRGARKAKRLGRQVVARPRQLHGFGNQFREIQLDVLANYVLVAHLARFQNLLHRAHQAVGIQQHQVVKFPALLFIHVAALQRLEVQPDRRDGGLQFVGDRIEKAIMLFVAADFADQKKGIQDHAGDDRGEKGDPEKQQDTFAPVENYPTDVQGDRECDQARAQDDEECHGFLAAGNPHDGLRRIVPQTLGVGGRWWAVTLGAARIG